MSNARTRKAKQGRGPRPNAPRKKQGEQRPPDPLEVFLGMFAGLLGLRGSMNIRCNACNAETPWVNRQAPQFCSGCGVKFDFSRNFHARAEFNGQQKTGPGPGMPHMSKRAAQEFMFQHSGIRIGDFTARETILQAYRKAALNLHPDKGGSHEQFCKLQEAMEVLG
jgi:DnaJ domain